ncbi:MFS-type transporter SLC18B1-like [Corticium candelabrum]|uniref:MFS-type transporter SLC18B1-like n=1 Tax=Corticium candelabrum TaxID=121492 RepID=UPI002E258A92|nr:MFS-type transporter SLC18B1-like [Corticium candelabrum]
MTMIGLRFVVALPIAVIASFFPQEVERWRPVSEASLYTGIITGVFGSTAILGSIASSQWVINDIGTRRLLCLTVFLLAMSTILFGCLGYTSSWPGFISLSIIIRLVQGFAYGLTDVIVYGLGTAASSEQMGLASGLLELSFAIGGASGPAIGGILHKVGGFGLPLFVTGGVMLGYMMVVVSLLSSSDNVRSRVMVPLRDVINMWTVSTAFCGFLANMCLSALVATLGAHLDRDFHMSPTIIGLVFLLTGIWYAMSCPLFGMLAELIGPRWVILLGLFAISAGVVVIAVAHTLTQLLIGQVISGIGLGSCFGSVYFDMSKEAELAGQPNSEERNSTLYAILSVFYNIGLMFGGIVGGAQASVLGFSMATVIIGVMVGSVATLYLVMSLLRIWYQHRLNINNTNNSNELTQ